MTQDATALDALTRLDLIAVSALIACWLGFGLLLRFGPPSTGEIMARWREEWFQRAAERDPRIVDSQLLANLRGGVAFLASASLAAIGGAVALLGQVERVEMVAETLGDDLRSPEAALAVKLLLVIAILSYALLAFLWSHRVFGYCAILLGAIPNAPGEAARRVAMRAAAVNIQAAANFNRGLRAIYVALTALAWLVGPEALLAATALTFGMLIRREYFSHTRRIVMGKSGE